MREGLSGEALGGALDAGGECLDTGLIEVAGVLARDRERLRGIHRAAVRAVGGERLEDVGDRQGARAQRKVAGGHAAVIAAAVQALVMGRGHRGEAGERRDARQDALGVRRMQADAGELVVGQPGRLVEDRVRDPELADVVQHPRAVQLAQLLRAKPSWRPIRPA